MCELEPPPWLIRVILIKISSDYSLQKAALVGCGVTTGIGAVTNTAQVQSGESVAVIGVGGVGLNVIQGARIAGAERIFAIDLVQKKLDYINYVLKLLRLEQKM